MSNAVYHEPRDLHRFNLGEGSSSGTKNEAPSSHSEQWMQMGRFEERRNDKLELNPLFMQQPSSGNRVVRDVNLNAEYIERAEDMNPVTGHPGLSQGSVAENNARAGCKRKAIDAGIGQSSSSIGAFHRGESSSSWVSGPSFYNHNDLNISLNHAPRALVPNLSPSPSPAISSRNFSFGANPTAQQPVFVRQPVPPPMSAPGHLQPVVDQQLMDMRYRHPFSNITPLNPNASAPSMPPRNMIPPFQWSGNPVAAAGSSAPVDRNSLRPGQSRLRSNMLANPLFVPAPPEPRNLAHGHVASASVQPPASSPTWAPYQNQSPHNQRRLSEHRRRSLISSLLTNQRAAAARSMVPPPAPDQHVVQPGGDNNFQTQNQAYSRAVPRQGQTAVGVPHSLRGLASTSRGRSRPSASEIRNVLDHMRRTGNLRVEKASTERRQRDDGDKIERRRRDRVYPLSCTKQTRSSDEGEIERRRDRARITTCKDSNNGDTHGGHSHDDDEKRSSLSLVTTSLWKEHPVTTNNNHTTRFKISSQKCRLLFTILLFTILIFTILYNNYKMRELKKCCLVLQLDSNEFCTTLRLPGRVYEAVETPDNPKAIIHHSKIDYVEKVEDILGKEEFSLIENSHIGSILKDGEVNEDASKKPVKVTKKRGRGNKDGEMNEDASKKPVKVTKKRGRGKKVNISMDEKGVTPPREVQQQVEDDAEVDAKDSENPETNGDGEMNKDASKKPVKVTKKRGRGNKSELDQSKVGLIRRDKHVGHVIWIVLEQPQEEKEHQEEDDTEVDVDDNVKGNENSETNKDGEVNEDASKKLVKVTKKRGRGNKDGEMNEDASKKPVKVTKKRGRGNKVNISMYNGMKKGVTPPREVQQQVEDDAEVDAKDSENPETNGDGEMKKDASKKPVKVTKKRGRGNKGIVGPNFGQYHNGPRSKT
ncbi:hypothetical protein F2Q70_00038407 [Brassica cretica]|uniref:Uncharacterized protein n=1 Tax=Brassica cretica TaxID=69181 RepID=A0A8S9KB28_BRACR|nr:hypothetical protein F2Q70_00038407 [Brassica cretica]